MIRAIATAFFCFFRVLIFLAFVFVAATTENIWAAEDSLSFESKKKIYPKRALILVSQDSKGERVFDFNSYKMTIKSLKDCGCFVDYKSAKTFEEAKGVLKKQSSGSIDILIIGGHGEASCIHFGSSNLTANKIEEKSFKLVKEAGIIVLDSCRTGDSVFYGECIAKSFSKKLGVTVFSPVTSVTRLQFVKNSEGVLPVFSLYGIVVPTRSFREGRVQYSDCMNDEHRKIAFNGCKLFDFVQFGHLDEAMSFLGKHEFSAECLVLVLCEAASKGYLELSRALIDANADLGETTEGGFFALRSAAFRGGASMVKMLLEAGANVNQVGVGGRTAIESAAVMGHAEVVSILIDAKADLGAVTEDGRFALETAASRGHVSVVEMLLEAGANVNQGRVDGRAAIDSAAVMGHAEVVSILIEAKADLGDVTEDGCALKVAAAVGHAEVVRILNRAQNKGNEVYCRIL